MQNKMGPVSVATLQLYSAIKCDICTWVKSISRQHSGQYSTLCSHYIFACICRKKMAVFEYFAEKLGITCNIRAAIWLMSRTVNKWICKKTYCHFCANLLEKERDSVCGKVTWQWPTKIKISLFGIVRWQPLKKRVKNHQCSDLKSFFIFHCQILLTYFSYQHAI